MSGRVIPIGRRFQPGQSGNPGGRPKGRSWALDLRDLLAQQDGKSERDRQLAIVECIVQKALDGDLKAVTLIMDILGERAPTKQQVDGTVGIAEALKVALERAKGIR